MIALLLVACGVSSPEASSDITSYTSASTAQDLASGLALCQEISETPLRSECVAFQVREHAREHTGASEKACRELPDGLWRDECFFLLADGAINAKEPQKTAPYCRDAGRYFQPCFMHLFKAHAGQLRSQLPQGEAHELFEKAVALGGTDAPKDFAHRAWSVFFRSSGGEDRLYDTSPCADLEGLERACVSGVREALARRLNRSAAPPELCTIEVSELGQWSELLQGNMGIRVAQDPALLAVLTPYQRRHCPPAPGTSRP